MKSHIIKHNRHTDFQKELDAWLLTRYPEDIISVTFTVTDWLGSDSYWALIIYKVKI